MVLPTKIQRTKYKGQNCCAFLSKNLEMIPGTAHDSAKSETPCGYQLLCCVLFGKILLKKIYRYPSSYYYCGNTTSTA